MRELAYCGRVDLAGARWPLLSLLSRAAWFADVLAVRGYPLLADLLHELEWYTLGIIHVNEMIDIYRLLLPPAGLSSDAQNRRDDLRNQIAGLCEGRLKLEGVGSENFIILPNFIEAISEKVDSANSRMAR